VQAQLLFGGRIREIGLAMFAAAAGLFCLIVPTFRPSSAVAPDYAGLVVTTVFSVLGLGILLASVPAARRAIRLLRHGTLTPGRVVDVRGRARQHAHRPHTEWLVTFEFERAHGDAYRCRVVASEAPDLGSEGTIVFDPRWPDHATSLDYLPGAPEIDATGGVRLREVRPHAAGLAALAIALWAVAVIRLVG
jgi:hypothetical protein